MRVGAIQGETLGLCLLLAAAVVIASRVAGFADTGAALGAGIVIGSLNGFTFQAVLDRRAPILATSIVRLAFFSLLAIAVARLAGWSLWPVVLGVGVAQIVMVGVGIRQGSRA